jgi:MFS family permease
MSDAPEDQLWLLTLLQSAARSTGKAIRGEVVHQVGGTARARVITVFACVLALNGADASTVGAIAPQLEAGLHIGNADLGLLSSVTLLVGAAFTIPVGLLVDRGRRVPLLAFTIVLWSVASLFSAFAGSFSTLLLARVALGAVAASAGPAISSLTGDYFAPEERGRIWSYVLVGEAAGTAFGFIISGLLASLIDWRAAFVVLALPGFYLARELWRTVPEPLRGGQSHLAIGAVDLHAATQASANTAEEQDQPEQRAATDDQAAQAALREGAEPDPRLILHEDPGKLDLASSVRYLFAIPSNVQMILGSSLGYFYFAGLQTFALLFVKGHYHASQAAAELALALMVGGLVIGALIGGRVTDALLERGRLAARMWFPSGCYLLAALFLLIGLLGTRLTPAVWFDVAGAALISAANPPIQAARLDVVPSGLWGRASSALTVVRSLAQSLAPLLFGAVSQLVAGIAPQQAPIGTHPHAPSAGTASGLQVTFLIMLGALVAASFFLFRASRTFATDVASAAASRARPSPGSSA